MKGILSFLDTLEEPAKRSYKDCNGCEYNRTLKDQIGWQFRGCFGGDYKGKPIAEIELCPLKVGALQEPEIPKDIEKDAVQYCFDKGLNVTPHEAKTIATHYLMIGHNEGYIKGRKDAHIPARELGLPKSMDFNQEPELDLEKEIDKTINECTNGYDFDWEKFARHFYELGKNARKED